jgi:ElaB/YqjD/DUF883 family membrane-anchored ribosome-binding protein
MSKANRLYSFWPNEKAEGKSTDLPDVERLVENVQPTIKKIGGAIAEHPRASLAVAATFGVVLGWFIKRK